MAKYIDKDKAYRIVLHYGSYVASNKIADMESIELIRCGECKHRFVDGENVRFNVCELNHNKVQRDDWFCADGERKEAQHE